MSAVKRSPLSGQKRPLAAATIAQRSPGNHYYSLSVTCETQRQRTSHNHKQMQKTLEHRSAPKLQAARTCRSRLVHLLDEQSGRKQMRKCFPVVEKFNMHKSLWAFCILMRRYSHVRI